MDFLQENKKKPSKTPAQKLVLSLLIILIMMSRIYLGAHYFSDVIAGASLATSYLLLLIDILEMSIIKLQSMKIKLLLQ